MKKQCNIINHKKKHIIFFDFDNTVTPYDILDDMLPRFSRNDRWMALEKRWKRGKIGSRDCLIGQVAGLRVSKKSLNRYLAGVRLDSHFKKLMELLRSQRIKAIVLSDNFDYIINLILRNNAVGKLKVYSNSVRLLKDRLIPSFPFRDKKCLSCAHCKAKNLLANADKDSIIFYVGDGHTDICPAKYADIVFAKEDLLRHFKDNKLFCLPYKSLKDVYMYFKRRLYER